MTNDGTNVDPGELHSYAGKLRDRAEAVREAADSAADINLGFAPYGTLNQWFGQAVRSDADEIMANLRTLADNLDGDATTLDASARDFQSQEDATTSNFRGMSTGD
ncbi:MAG: hypothetical protein WBA97_02340 [Actinophytocola sp.]|uniref:hypothetical protein n=1 Tax=Actinophytocola sp. TaxID=1872138 RepID=UPI003C724CD9